MKKNNLTTQLFLILVLMNSTLALAAETLTVTSVTDSLSVVENQATQEVEFNLIDSLGGTNSVYMNIQSGEYWVTSQDYDIFTGSISQAAQDEYYVDGVPLPCFTGIWSAVGCMGAAAASALYCEIRTGLNIRRGHRQCQQSSSVFHVTGITGCGNVSGYCHGLQPAQPER